MRGCPGKRRWRRPGSPALPAPSRWGLAGLGAPTAAANCQCALSWRRWVSFLPVLSSIPCFWKQWCFVVVFSCFFPISPSLKRSPYSQCRKYETCMENHSQQSKNPWLQVISFLPPEFYRFTSPMVYFICVLFFAGLIWKRRGYYALQLFWLSPSVTHWAWNRAVWKRDPSLALSLEAGSQAIHV